MITESILIVFAIVYYVFSVFLFATIIQDVNKKHTIPQILGMVVEIMILSPIAVPIILGIKIGEATKEN